ncbi:flagellar biosynthetic protein FliO [Dankookia sp. P2]|uniref:flagellar biosynthetic protein FliO n=1 Tax=Dankookia sp. P2 TaxID=3423955 RepID=UPI003D6660C8
MRGTLVLARALVESGRQIDLTGLDAGAAALCAAITMLPIEAARPMLPSLVALLAELDGLGAALTPPDRIPEPAGGRSLILDMDGLLRAFGTLAALLIPLSLAARALRGGQRRRPGRRLGVTEVVAVDARRRLVLVRCDGKEVLLLTGGGQDAVLGWLPERSAP